METIPNCELRIYEASDKGAYKEVNPSYNGIYKVKDGNHIKIKAEAGGFWVFLRATPKGNEKEGQVYSPNKVSIERFVNNDKQIIVTDFNVEDWCEKTGKNEEDMGKIEVEITIAHFIYLNGVLYDYKKREIDPNTRKEKERKYVTGYICCDGPSGSRGFGSSPRGTRGCPPPSGSRGCPPPSGSRGQSNTALVEGSKSSQSFRKVPCEIFEEDNALTIKTTLTFEAVKEDERFDVN